MIARSHRGRSGITLTEILIAILIMGIGLISLATLFPLGLIRLREATRFQRGGMLVQSASDDIEARDLFLKSSFTQTWYGNQDPFTLDANIGAVPVSTVGPGLAPLPGLPVCYDPLWRAVTNTVPLNDQLYDGTLDYAATYRTRAAEARFGGGIVFDAGGNAQNPYGLADTNASAHGLQRISNFIPWSSTNNTTNFLYPFTYQNPNITLFPTQARDVAADVFTSIDDIVFNSSESGVTGPSPLLPDFNLGSGDIPTNDWRFTWFFTGRQVDSTNGTMFEGDVVVCDGRPFAFNDVTYSPAGETVVQAIFGYSSNVNNVNDPTNGLNPNGIANTGFATGSDRTVLLRWPTSIPDPSIRIGSWIADVTYERFYGRTYGDPAGTSPADILGRVRQSQTPFQRCDWYRVAKRTDPQPDPVAGYRQIIVTIASPVRTKTLLTTAGASIPGHTNVALIMPSVVNVYPRSFTIH
ncbi:type IV pilus modification PilV family protein [Tundrisphaera lichenicola]|uniref:type IV pilus modification PilV family protein n=1 Tax=Tundrisphaera lichenicola TaxID=2029860 RepID=UPI003EB8FE09